MVSAEADPAGILWTHPNGIGFRSGVYGLGLNAHIPTGGYPHSHGLLVKREAEAEPHGYYGYGRVCERMSYEVMAIRVVEFSNGGYKIRKIFALETTYSKENIEF